MLTYLKTDIFTSPCQTLVNTVNTVGVMGKGIAKSFKDKYPEMFARYKELCDQRQMSIGNLYLWRGPQKWVLNFPTKTTWRQPSKLEYIEKGLTKFVDNFEKLGITSISFPPLGCGNGQLNWSDEVKPLMEKYLKKLPLQIYIHEVSVGQDFVPEHLEHDQHMPASFESFLNDVQIVVHKNKCHFTTLKTASAFEACTNGRSVKIIRNSGAVNIPEEAFLIAWSTLQNGLLSIDQFSDNTSSRYKSYLFPILAQLPYITVTQTSTSFDDSEKYALLLKNPSNKSSEAQGTLWQSA